MTRFRLLQQVQKRMSIDFSSKQFRFVSFQLDIYVEHLTAAVVNDDIFNHICTGFTDQEPAIREATVKVRSIEKEKKRLTILLVDFRRCYS